MPRKRHLALSIALAVLVAGIVVAPVDATYPGERNGRIAFSVRAADGSANIFSVTSSGRKLRQLTSGPGNRLCPAFSADGRRIAYCANTSGRFEIWTMKPDGSNQQQLTHLGGLALFPDLSPNGRRVAFGGIQGSDSHSEIYVVKASTGGGLEQLTSCAAYGPGCFNQFPAWSPNGRRIAFIHADDRDAGGHPVNEQVWVMDANGKHAHRLTSGSAPKDQVPDWSPDGLRIAFASGAAPDSGIWVMNANGSHQHQLTGCHVGDASPCATGNDFGTAWSPDGRKIAFLRELLALGTNDRAVFVMNADGSHQHRLTAAPTLQAVPAWQPRDDD